jgi:PBP1b-binding outer membrane lipoprotein LpoB
MNRLILISLLALLWAGCDGPLDTYDKLNQKFPGADIATLPGMRDQFVIRTTNNSVFFGRRSGEAGIATVQIFRAKP